MKTQTHETDEPDDCVEESINKVLGHPIPTSVLNADNDLLKSYNHSKRVGNYLLGKTLGEGSFAKVKEALHSLTSTKVAIKIIDKKKAARDAYVRKNLRREGRLLQMVRHDNIAHLYEIMETDNFYYLVLELCEGGDLMDRIYKHKRLPEAEARKYMRQIMSAVDYLHKRGIIHRDLKIENLLLSERHDVKIIDFGLSNIVKVCLPSESLDKRSMECLCATQCGSPAYAAPELLANKKYGPEVDVWSIGVNMYAMLTGTLPFTVQPFNIQQLQNKMLKSDMNPLPEHLSYSCKDLIKKLLTPNPAKRITLSQAMQHSWIKDGMNGGYMHLIKQPKNLRQIDLDVTILAHIADKLKFRSSEVSQLVLANTPHPYTATYLLLKRKLDRWKSVAAKHNNKEIIKIHKNNPPLSARRETLNEPEVPPPEPTGVNEDVALGEKQPATTVEKSTDQKRQAEVAKTKENRNETAHLRRKNTDIQSSEPVNPVTPPRRCDSVDSSSTRTVALDSSLTAKQKVELSPLTCEEENGRLSVDDSLGVNVQKRTPIDSMEADESLPSRVRIAPIRLLGQGPYVIKSTPKPDLPSVGEKILDYEEWRQVVLRRNIIDTTEYNNFANTRTKTMQQNSTDSYTMLKYSRPNPMLKPTKSTAGYENNQMAKILPKRTVQTNYLLYDSATRGDSRDMTSFTSTTYVTSVGFASLSNTNTNVTLPSIGRKEVKKREDA